MIVAAFAFLAAALWWILPWLLTPVPFEAEARGAEADADAGAVIRVYGADVWGVRGRYAIHTWIALKPAAADEYDIYEVIGWRLRRGQPALKVSSGDPARHWFGSPPILLYELRGVRAAELLDDVEAAVASYPYAREYEMWPGPNSNSFVAWVGLTVPELGLELPAKAIGQRWMKRNLDRHRQ